MQSTHNTWSHLYQREVDIIMPNVMSSHLDWNIHRESVDAVKLIFVCTSIHWSSSTKFIMIWEADERIHSRIYILILSLKISRERESSVNDWNDMHWNNALLRYNILVFWNFAKRLNSAQGFAILSYLNTYFYYSLIPNLIGLFVSEIEIGHTISCHTIIIILSWL